MLIAITPYIVPDNKLKQHLQLIEPYIDSVILRLPQHPGIPVFIQTLLHEGFPVNKLIVHRSIELMEAAGLQKIHFREMEDTAFQLKTERPDIQVSMSVHSAESCYKAADHHIDFGLFGHLFPSASKISPPRTQQEVTEALAAPLPLVALGGINLQTIHQLPRGFIGVAGISIFQQDEAVTAEFRKDCLTRIMTL